MSIDLILEVMDHAPADLTSGERLALIVIAERANDKTRLAVQSSRWTLGTIAHRAGVKRTGLKSIFQGLARKGCEVRVPVKTGPEGKHVFAFEGTAMTFKVPRLAERGGQSLPTKRGGQGIPSDDEEGMSQHPRGEVVASERGGHSHPQSLKTLKEPSKISLSDARTSVPAPRDSPDEDRERDVSTSSEDPNLTPQQLMVIEAGCPEHLSLLVVEYLEAKYDVRGLGWWRTVKNQGDLPALVQEGIAANTPTAAAADLEPVIPCPLHSRRPLANCGVCWADVKGGTDPYTGREDERPPGWWAIYNEQGRSGKRGNANAEGAAGWLALRGSSRQLHNSHDNPERYDVKL